MTFIKTPPNRDFFWFFQTFITINIVISRQKSDFTACLTITFTIRERIIFMNKNELIASVAEKADLTKVQAAEAVDAVLTSISGSLASGTDVRILGFGNFIVAQRKATTARNPQTGAPIDVPAAKVPRFKPGKALKEAVNV